LLNTFRSHARTVVFCFLFISGAVFLPHAAVAESRDALWNIVTTCLDIHVPEYCKRCPSPRLESPCARDRDCKATTEVWEETAEYVVIRDRKMCGCAPDFEHGLVIPRSRITGIEDPRRPDSIWSIAWAAAQKRITDDSVIALVVNPPGLRTQDQLHVHIVRLQSAARELFDAARMTRVQSLDDVWSAAAKKAATLNLHGYGVLVTPNLEGGFLVVVETGSPEKLYTQAVCR
jgi:CDP-diacylglycerol pyrophosphatase